MPDQPEALGGMIIGALGTKDTSGPSLNILIKLMSIIALTLLPLFL